MSERITSILARRDGREPHPIELTSRPATGVAVVTCMDARLDVYRVLALREGDAHVIRNAGGTITPEVTMSLAVSQRVMGTREILVLHHVDCGMRRVDDKDLADGVQRDTGHRPPWTFMTSSDPAVRIWEAVRQLASDPFLHHTELVLGVLYDERADTIAEVCRAGPVTGRRRTAAR